MKILITLAITMLTASSGFTQILTPPSDSLVCLPKSKLQEGAQLIEKGRGCELKMIEMSNRMVYKDSIIFQQKLQIKDLKKVDTVTNSRDNQIVVDNSIMNKSVKQNKTLKKIIVVMGAALIVSIVTHH